VEPPIRVIDADTHIDETEDTWNWLREDEVAYRPTTAFPPNPDPSRPPARYWLVDGRRQPRFIKDDAKTQTTVETRELLDPPARVGHMDHLGTAVQVIYPSLFLVGVTDKPAIEVALKRSYNRWLADRTQATGGRLRWVCLPPLMDMGRAIEEVRFAKANGACAVMKKGDREAGHWANEEYYFPLYEECQRLDLPIVFHIGSGVPDYTSSAEFPWARFAKLGAPPLHAFFNLVTFGVPAKFPGLRWGFIEAGASWVPFLVYDLRRRMSRGVSGDGGSAPKGYTYENDTDIVTKNRFWITCQVDEDLPYILRYTTEDRLLVGSDYTHNDASMEMDFPQRLQQRVAAGDIPLSAVRKIVHDNAKAFYGL
jgi:predicted TIM-barrel fold metal-dependent hydrolase